MSIEIVAIGDELLAGHTLNGNAALMSRHLTEAGYDVTRHTVLPDEAVALRGGLERALGENKLVLCTGGLGPTVDDNTRRVVAELVGCDLALNEEVAAHLRERFGESLASLEDQATIPSAARPLHNGVGTAPGLLFRVDGSLLILLPGVPPEMEAMFVEQVMPLLVEELPDPHKQVHESIHLFQTREFDVDLVLRKLPPSNVGIGIYPRLGVVTVRLRADTAEEIAPVREEIVRAFSDRLFDSPSGTLEEAVHLAAVKEGVRVCTAESCTAGGVAAQLTRFSGASDFFAGGIASYSNEVKEKVLGVEHRTLVDHGAVSEETAREMVEGALRMTGADLGVSISGIAGPTGGTEEKPVGTVCFAVGRAGRRPQSCTCHFKGNRASIIQRSINQALSLLLQAI